MQARDARALVGPKDDFLDRLANPPKWRPQRDHHRRYEHEPEGNSQPCCRSDPSDKSGPNNEIHGDRISDVDVLESLPKSAGPDDIAAADGHSTNGEKKDTSVGECSHDLGKSLFLRHEEEAEQGSANDHETGGRKQRQHGDPTSTFPGYFWNKHPRSAKGRRAPLPFPVRRR